MEDEYDQDVPQEDLGEVTAEEKQQIATNFILSSPPGEENEVLNAVRTIVADDSVLDSSIFDILRTYNTEQMIPVAVPDTDEKVLITQHGEVDPTHYVDPTHARLVTFDHIKREITDTQPLEQEELSEIEPLRAAVDSQVSEYVKSHFPEGTYAVYANAFEDGSHALVICINSSMYAPRNFRSARWRSVWTCTLSDYELKGQMNIHIHIYEAGNVQLRSEKEATAQLGECDNEQLAQAIVEQMERAESELQSSVESSLTSLSDTTFRALRRALPITKKRIDWNNVLSQAGLGRELGGK
eukprot:gnl/Trimastix_PCT/367.p1 GENE.gnl/Trimastix_PCT/367~~gnl/Trimastix_PCT/367.p1  ORF type:complete len:298 (-),score=88.70 gnl/Trimastix_PCT/367:99-992(-)